MSAPTFLTLPYEIRLMIYEQAFPSKQMQALKCLGFRNPHMEAPCPNIAIKLSAAALMDLYKSNPAGESRGRFWQPVPLLAVCRQIKEEAWSVFGKIPVTVGTWMSFLSNRPLELLTLINHVNFKYWITMKWNPVEAALHQPGQTASLETWVASIAETWSNNLERLSAMMPTEHLPKLTIDLTLIHPPVYTYRLHAGLTKDMLKFLKERLAVVTDEALTKFQVDGRWPDQEMIVDGTHDYRDRDLPALAPPAISQVIVVA